jgi:hypothetical protein
MSQIPGGYGIYCLPYEVTDDGAVVYGENLRMVFAIDPEAEVVQLFPSADDSRLLLVTREEGVYWLTVIDRAEMTQLQKFELLDNAEDQGVWTLYPADDFFVLILGNLRFAVVSGTPGDGYALDFTADLNECDAMVPYLASDAAMDFDGEKLAVAAEKQTGEFYSDKSCSFYLAVFDRTGLLYFGEYDSSLDVGNPDDYTDRCRLCPTRRSL